MTPADQLKAIRAEFEQLKIQHGQLAARTTEVERRMAALQMQAGQLALLSEPAPSPAAPGAPGPVTATPAAAPPTKPTSAPDGQGERLLALLRRRPRAPMKWLAEQMYGDPTATGKVSSLLDYLRKTGKAKKVAHGQWEAVS